METSGPRASVVDRSTATSVAGWRRFEPGLSIATAVLACHLATFSVDVLGESSAPQAIRWSFGLPSPAFAWAHVEPGAVIPLDEDAMFIRPAPVDIPWLGFDALRTGSSWTQGLHVDVPGFAIDGIVACVMYLLLRWILRSDSRFAVRAVVIGAVSSTAVELFSPTGLDFQGRVGWLSLAACVLLVPPSISVLARQAVRGMRTRLVMCVIAAWILFALVRFSDPLLRGRIWSEPWHKSDHLIAVLVLTLVWWPITVACSWWLRRREIKSRSEVLETPWR